MPMIVQGSSQTHLVGPSVLSSPVGRSLYRISEYTHWDYLVMRFHPLPHALHASGFDMRWQHLDWIWKRYPLGPTSDHRKELCNMYGGASLAPRLPLSGLFGDQCHHPVQDDPNIGIDFHRHCQNMPTFGFYLKAMHCKKNFYFKGVHCKKCSKKVFELNAIRV